MFSLTDLPELIFSMMAVLIALSVHEFAHAYAAYKLGDNTARYSGRLSLNPLKHIDIAGAVCMLLFRFGWAKPVPINPRNFEKPKRDFAITAIAGPLANIFTAFISTLLFLIFYKILPFSINTPSQAIVYNTCLFLQIFSTLNVGLGVFNLLPIPPFDGSRILNVILPEKLYFGIMRYERQIYWGVIAWLLIGPYVYSTLVALPFIANNEVLSIIVRIFDLSGLISDAISAIYGGMIWLWQLIPILK